MTCPHCSAPTARPGWCESCDIEDQLALDATRARTFLCAVCRENIVSPADGEDTCPTCRQC